MSTISQKYLRYVTILFVVSLVGLGLHALDDAFLTRENKWYGISVAEFLLYVALVYLIVPPLGLLLTRRGNWIGIVILLGYAFQAFYGGGVNHVRHLFGSFSGSQFLPTLLKTLGVNYEAYLNQKGFVPVLMNMAGLGVTPPHTHTLLSNIIVFFNIGLNLTLMGYLALLARELWINRKE